MPRRALVSESEVTALFTTGRDGAPGLIRTEPLPLFRRTCRPRSLRGHDWCGRRESNPDLECGALALCRRAASARLVDRGRNRTSCPGGTAFTARRRHQPVLT